MPNNVITRTGSTDYLEYKAVSTLDIGTPMFTQYDAVSVAGRAAQDLILAAALAATNRTAAAVTGQGILAQITARRDLEIEVNLSKNCAGLLDEGADFGQADVIGAAFHVRLCNSGLTALSEIDYSALSEVVAASHLLAAGTNYGVGLRKQIERKKYFIPAGMVLQAELTFANIAGLTLAGGSSWEIQLRATAREELLMAPGKM